VAKPPELPVVPDDTYTDRAEFARGGLGRIVRATDRSMGRTVAIKELLPGSAVAESRFIREALVTGRLEHPSIVPVYEAGRWPSGAPFYAMKLVSGRSLSAVVRETGTLAERLALIPAVIDVAEAIAYAHSKGVIHRDIKPSNVIVGQFGETVVIDWGLAKERGTDDADAPAARSGGGDEVTGYGDVLGTPAYMAPEQAKGETVDERADVYALGALLYFVLAGVPPHEPTRSEGPAEARERALAAWRGSDAATTTRTDAVTAAAMREPVPLEERRPDVPRELSAIARKAMARNPGARYPTAKEFADDVKAFQTGRLVSAHRYTALGLVGRWVRRNRVPVAVGAVALALLVAGGAASLARIVEARNTAVGAQAAEKRAREQAERHAQDLVLLQARASLARDPTAALAWLKGYPPEAPGWDAARGVVAEAMARGVAREVWRIGPGQISAVSLSADGRWLAVADAEGRVRLRDQAGRGWRVLGQVGATGPALAFSPDGRTLVAGGDTRDVVLLPVDGSPPRVLGHHDDAVVGVAFAPDGKRVASTGVDRVVRIWSLDGGATAVLRGHELLTTGVAFAPDGTTLASGSEDATLRLWDLADGRQLKVLRADRSVLEVAFSPDGRHVAAATRSGPRIWDVATGGSRPVGDRPWGEAYAVAWDRGGRLVTAGVDGLAVWDPDLGTGRWLIGHDGAVTAVALGPDGGTIVSGGADGSVRVWPLRPDAGVRLRDDDQPAGTGARPRISRDGRRVAAPGQDGSILVVEGGESRRLTGHTGPVREIAFAPDGAKLVSYGLDRTVRLWDLASGAGRVLLELPTQAFRLRIAGDGRHVAFTQGFEELDVYDLAEGRTSCVFRGHNDSASEFTPDGAGIAYADNYDLLVGDLASCSSRRLYGHKGTLFGIGFAPGGARVATASADHTVAVAPFPAGAPVATLRGHDKEVYAVAFAPDGRTLASAGFDGVARLWDVAGARELRALRGHDKVLLFLAFLEDGAALATAGADDTVRVWDVASGDMVQRETDTGLGGIAAARDWIVSSGPHGVRRWPVDRRDAVPPSSADLLRFIAGATTARIDEAGRLESPRP
jgi:WD40 repeat protein